jgi:hypothetical protein
MRASCSQFAPVEGACSRVHERSSRAGSEKMRLVGAAQDHARLNNDKASKWPLLPCGQTATITGEDLPGFYHTLNLGAAKMTGDLMNGIFWAHETSALAHLQPQPCVQEPIGNTANKSCKTRGANSLPLITFLTSRSRSLPPRTIEGERRRFDVVEFKKRRKSSCFEIWMGGWGMAIVSGVGRQCSL